MFKQLLADFAAPGNEYRGAPFWSLNGKLEEDAMRAEIRNFRAMGFGGFFFHSRAGMATPYLSEEWFKMFGVAVDEAAKNNLKVWIYDEDRWPSGAAGGLVTRDARYKVRYLVCHQGDEADETPCVARFAARFTDGILQTYRRLADGETPAENETLLSFHRHLGADDPWFNNACYLDTLNSLAVKAFIQTTHEAYFRRFGQYFGNVIAGFFSDEPNFNSFPGGKTLPWTDDFAKTFQTVYHYDITDHLPELVFSEKSDFNKAKLEFRDHLTFRFDEAFGKTIGDWCKRHGVVFTGHLLGEDTLSKMARNVGSAMRFYPEMQMPGIDLLTEHALFFNTAKQCVSVARQLGMPRRLTECYGCTGWDFSFAGYRALGEWQYALGINFRCLHHALYTLKGSAKRDYPASIAHQSPWAKEFRAVEDYFARLGAALARGKEVCETLVLHPIGSAFGHIAGTAEPVETEKLIALTNQLLAHQLDFDFGDEELLAQNGKIKDGKLHVGQAAYASVILPEMATLRATTLDLLERFADAGGKLLFLGEAPVYLDGKRSLRPAEVYRKFAPFALDKIQSDFHLSENGNDVESVLALEKKGSDFATLYLVNTGCDFSVKQSEAPRIADRKQDHLNTQVDWNLPETFHLYRFDVETGKIFRHRGERKNGKLCFDAKLAALHSALFVATNQNIPDALPEIPTGTKHFTPLPDAPVAITLEEENLLVLDSFTCTADGQAVAGKTYLQQDAALRKLCGAAPREGGVQPWCESQKTPKHTFQLEMRTTFRCEVIPQGDLALAMEDPELYTISLNGNEIQNNDVGFWCDAAIRKLIFPAKLLHQGANELVLKRRYDETTPGLECLFLLGDFGVKKDALTAPVTHLSFGDWTKQGLPYYAGNVVYHLELPDGSKSIRFPKIGGAALVDAATCEVKMLPPYEIAVKGNSVDVRLLGSRRNAFGPFYLDDHGQPMRRGAPPQFAALECETKQLVPGGILTPPEVEA